MVRFPSQEWADRFRAALNANTEYAEAARAWEGDILFLVAPDTAAAKGEGVLLALSHGQCGSAAYVSDPVGVASEFVFEGRREDWTRLLSGELDPVKAILRGTFRIRGNMAKLLRFNRAATLLAATAASISTET
ncbi:MAG: SCP2 sterol-binding domain-containing protein [Thermoplasmata archaeon]|nr:SCP2 sterol-binding domain-containing protein [Thermoplasmata archaeon]